VELKFDSFAVALTNIPTYFIITLRYLPGANPAHRINLILWDASGVDCGGDPVTADHWPIGSPDVALPVNLTTFTTEQDTAFGVLHVVWTVASELDNAGFMLSRKAETDSVFHLIATHADPNTPELRGRGTSPSEGRYMYRDIGLTPGVRYTYRLAAQSLNGYTTEFEMEAAGTPRLAPVNFVLNDAYPNPFNQDVTITYVVPYTAKVQIFVYDLLGRQVRKLVGGLQAPAEYHALWDSRDDRGVIMPSGLYFFRMQAGGKFDQTKKVLLLR
jgi:hypothetical protein